MQSGRSVTHRYKSPFFGLLAGLVVASLVGSWILAQPDGQPAARSRVFRLKHLSAQAAEKLVAGLNLRGELSVVGTDAVIFTSTDSGELRVASAVFQVVDSPKTYTLTPVEAPASFLEACRKNPLVFNIEGFAVGTFNDPPRPSSAHSALVDVRADRLLVIAPKDNGQPLIEAVRDRIAAADKPATTPPPSPPNEKSDARSEPAAETSPTATTAAEEPFVGPPAPPTEELARRSTESTSPAASKTTDQTASVTPPETTPAEKPKTADEGMLTAPKPAAQTEPNATPAAPVQGEDKIDQAIERAVEAEKEAVLAELEAAEAERKAKETDEALAKLMALVDQADQPGAGESQTSTTEAEPEGEQAPPASDQQAPPAPPAATESEPTETAQPKPAPAGRGSTRPTAKPAAAGPSESEKAAEKPAQAAPAQKPVGEATEPDAKALTPEQMKQIEAEGQAGLMKLLELVQSEAAKSQPEPSVPPRPTPSTDTTTPAPPQPKAAPKIPVQPGTQAPEQTPAPTPKPTPSEAQTARRPTDDYIDHLNIPDAEKEIDVTVTLPEQIEIMALIELVGKELGLNYVYDPTQVKGTVMLKVHDGKIKVKDTYALLESVLKFKGLVMTRRGNLVTIIREAEALKYDPAIITPERPIQPGDIIVTGVMQLENITTQTAENMLKSMQLGLGFNSIPETQTLIVTDYAYRMRRIQEIIGLVDVSGQQRRITSRTLKYTVASKLAPKVQTLAGFLDTVQVTVSEAPAAPAPATPAQPQARTTTARPATPARPTPAAASQAQAADTVHLDTDDRTNRIFMIGLEDKVKVVEGLIDQLDVPGQSLRTIREYEIQYIDTSEVVNALYELGVISTRPETTAPVGTLRSTPSRTPTPSRPRPSAAEETASPDDPLISVRQATNSLLINATEEQHAEIAMVIAHVDTEQTDSRTIKEYEIQHVDAAEIINTLSELGFLQPETRGMTGTSGTTRTTPTRTTTPPRPTQPGANPQAPAQAAPAPPAASGGGEPATAQDIVADYPQIAVLEATNSLLVSATPRQHAAIALIISHVDRELDQVSTPFVVYALENQDPEELAGTLGELVNAQIRAQAAQTGGAAAGAAGGAAATRDPRIQTRTTPGAGRRSDDFDITIVPDKATYSLVVYANKKNQQWISELIKELDNYRPQVLLDVTLVEITQQDAFTSDLNIISSIPDLAYTSGATGSVVDGRTISDLLDDLSAAPDRDTFIDLQSNSGNFTGFYGDNKIQALFTAMQRKNYGRILAKPKLLVDDNQEGTIETRTTTYVTRRTTNIQSVEGGNPIQTENVNFEPYDASINLAIKPHISKGDNLRLEITLSRTDFTDLQLSSTGGESDEQKPPDQAVTDVQTVVTVPDSATIILGGMDKINQSKGGDKVPLLGDLPLLGGLFRSTNNSSTQSKLYIFIKAHILRPGDRGEGREDLVRISRRNRAEFEEAEQEMQEYEDWPGIKPKPMDPLRVLEEDIGGFGEVIVPGQDQDNDQ